MQWMGSSIIGRHVHGNVQIAHTFSASTHTHARAHTSVSIEILSAKNLAVAFRFAEYSSATKEPIFFDQ